MASNAGPDPASSLVFTLPLPAGMTFSSITPPTGWTCTTPAVGAGGTVTCMKPSLNVAPPTATFMIVATTTTPGMVTATATISTTGTDATAADNAAMATTNVTPPNADLALTKTGAPGTVNVGQNVTYTLTVTNNGPNTALAVILTDTLPANVTFVSATPTQGTCSQAAGTVTCNIGTMNNAATVTTTIVVTPQAAAVPSITNMASVSAMNPDPTAADNSASAMTTVNPVADLSLAGSASPNPVATGGTLNYTLTVTNNGPSPAAGVSLADTLPMGTTFVSVPVAPGTCMQTTSGGSTVVTCTIGTLASGSSATVMITVTAPSAPGSITNMASVTATTMDPNTANNSASQTTMVNAAAMADFSLSAMPSSESVNAGGVATYTVTATSLNGFTGTVSITCGPGPLLTICFHNPPSVTLASGGTASTTVNITTMAPGSSGPPVMERRDGPQGIGAAPIGVFLLLALALLAMRNTGMARQWRWATVTMRLAAVVLLCVFASGCNNGRGTPKGSFPIPITGAAGSLSHTINVTLVVQ